MTTIVTTGIDATKPVAGTPTTQSVRDNTLEIKTQLGNAGTDIDNLANGTTTHTNFVSTGIDDNATATALTLAATTLNATFGGDIKGTGNTLISTDTSDATDNAVLQLTGGGAFGPTRGSSIGLYGNEASQVGRLFIDAGNIATGYIDLRTANNVSALKLDYDQNATFGGNVSVTDNKYLYLGTDSDGKLIHTGINFNIINATGTFYIDEQVNSGLMLLRSFNSVGAAKTGIQIGGATPNVSLYYDGAVALSTTALGLNVNSPAGNTTIAMQQNLVNKHALYTDGSQLGVWDYTASLSIFQVDKPATAGQTGILLYDVDNATLERVTVGAADSGGAGFKVLRIPN